MSRGHRRQFDGEHRNVKGSNADASIGDTACGIADGDLAVILYTISRTIIRTSGHPKVSDRKKGWLSRQRSLVLRHPLRRPAVGEVRAS